MCYNSYMRNGKLEEVRERLLERSKEELADAVINSRILISRLQQKLDQEKGKAKDMRQTIFGRSSEQSMYLFPMDELQDSLAKALEDFHEDDKVTVREHVRQKRERSVTSLPADTPVFEVDHSGDDPDEVEKDGVVYVKSGTRSVDRIDTSHPGTSSGATSTASTLPRTDTCATTGGRTGSCAWATGTSTGWRRVRASSPGSWWASSTTICRSTGRRRCSPGTVLR